MGASTTPQLTIRTNFTPAVTINPLSKTEATGLKSVLLKLLQPSIDGELPIIGHVHYAPNGEPSDVGLFAMAAVLLLAVYGLYELAS